MGRCSDIVRVFTPSDHASFHVVEEGGGVKQAKRIRAI